MAEVPQNHEPVGEGSVIQRSAAIARYTFGVVKAILFIAPLVVVLVIIVLALLGPAIGNTFSNIVSSL